MVWRSAIRSLRSSPVAAAVAVLSLALGIGSSSALFSILDSLLLRSLPVRDPAGLALLWDARDNSSWTNLQWEQIRDRPSLFNGAIASASARFNLSRSGQADFVDGLYASGSFFDVLGVPTVLGRAFTASDDHRSGGIDGPVAVLGYGFWQRRFGGAADALGQTITLDRVPFTIVGVASPAFFGVTVGRAFDVAVPIATEALVRGRDSGLDRRSYWWLSVMVRLRPGQTIEQATTAIRAVQSQVREATRPDDWPAAIGATYLADPFEFRAAATGDESGLRARYQRPLVTMMVAVGLLLLVACANIANLMLARAAGRRHELAVRAALGASKLTLARPLLVESLILSGVGALVGLVFAQWTGRLLVAALSTSVSRVFLDLSLDWRVLGFTAAISTAAAVVFGTVPAFGAARAKPQEALAERGRATTGGGRLRLSGALVVTQVALSLVLVVCAGLFARSFASLAYRDLGFDREQVLVVNVNARQSADELPAQKALYERLRLAARTVPGVQQAAISAVTPISGSTWQYGVEVVGEPPRAQSERGVHVNILSSGWFATYGTALVAGRDLNDRDVDGSPPAALVNREFVRRFLNGKDPLGRAIQQVPVREPTPPFTIVGVVEDAVYRSLRAPVPPTLYVALAQHRRAIFQTSLSIRSAGPPVTTLIRPLAAALARVDANISFTFRPLADQIGAALIQERLVAVLSGFFGSLALLLAALGLYGVTSLNVSRRRGEIGVRMALGGTPAGVVRLVLQRASVLVSVGVVIGGLVSYWAAGLVTTLVFGLEPRDSTTFVAAVLVLMATGLLAAWLPARRASRIDPVTVLREI